MKRLIALTGILLSFMISPIALSLTTAEQTVLLNNKMGTVANKVGLGTVLIENRQAVAVGVFNPSGVTGDRTIAAHDTMTVSIPDNAVIERIYCDVITTFTSATDAATIALSLQGANDVKSAIAISDGSNPWDVGLEDTIQVGTVATMLKLTAARKLVATVAVEALTAGKMYCYVNYALGF
jgi:hypothetical protein